MLKQNNKVAIIGLGFRFPGDIRTLDQYYTALCNKEDLVSELPNDRFSKELFQSNFENAKGHCKKLYAGSISKIFDFDYRALNLSKKEVEAMDPQQRLCLEMTIDALTTANIAPTDFADSNTAVFIGAASTDMAMSKADDLVAISAYGMTGTNLSIISNRLSHFFNLHGPSMTIDTACSSSMVALSQAFNYINNNKDSMCLAGGVNVLLSPMPFIGFSQAHMLSPDGRCKVFDDSANGYVRAEGGAVLLLKSLDKAIADKDNIFGVISDCLVNQDGKTPGISLPSACAQETLLKDIYTDVDISKLAYVEAHGTGTNVGDPIETGAIGHVLGQSIKKDCKRKLLIGSVKSNVGHLETASGMAGLVKALLVLKYKKIPATINIKKLNTKIDFDNLGLEVVQDLVDLPKVEGKALVGVNSFGFGGTNVHAILEECTDTINENKATFDINVENSIQNSIFKLNYSSEDSLYNLVASYKDLLTKDNYKKVISTNFYTQYGFDNAFYADAQDFESLNKALDSYLTDYRNNNFSNKYYQRAAKLKNIKKTVFVFSGNGSQYIGMGKELYTNDSLFKQIFDDIDNRLQKYQNWSVADYILQADNNWDLQNTEIVQPIVFALEAAMSLYLKKYGISADSACGHSVGEVAAAFYCGALSLDDACKVIVYRSKNQAKTLNMGDMAVVRIDSKLLNELLANERFNKVQIGATNAKDSFTLSGDKAQLQDFIALVKEKYQVAARLLNLNYPFHSSFMDAIEDSLKHDLKDISSNKLICDFYSAVTDKVCANECLANDYWWHNIRDDVKFYQAIKTALADGCNLFVEIGPKDILLNYVKSVAKEVKTDIQTFAYTSKKDLDTLSNLKAAFLSSNLFKDRSILFNKSFVDRTLALPLYPFDRHDVRLKYTSENQGIFVYKYNELLGKQNANDKQCFINEIDLDRNSYIKGHNVLGKVLYPAAAFINTLKLMAQDSSKDSVIGLDDIVIMRSLELNDNEIYVLKTQKQGSNIYIGSRVYNETNEFDTICKATQIVSHSLAYLPYNIEDVIKNNTNFADDKILYTKALQLGIDYQDSFKAVTRFALKDKLVYLELKNDHLLRDDNAISIFALDGVLQSLFAYLNYDSSMSANLMLPSFVDSIRVNRDITHTASLKAIVELKKFNDFDALLDAYIFDEHNNYIMSLKGIRYLKYVNAKEQIKGLFTQKLIKQTCLIDNNAVKLDTLLKDELKANLIARKEDKSEQEQLLTILIASYIYKLVKITDKDASMLDIFADNLTLNFNEDLAIYLLDFLCSINLAKKIDDLTYNVSSEFADIASEQIFTTLISTDSSVFFTAELVCRIGENLLKLLNNEVKIEDVLAYTKDSVFNNYFYNNKYINELSYIYSSFILNNIEKYKDSNVSQVSILELYTNNLSLFLNLEDLIKNQEVKYSVICLNEVDYKHLTAYFESYANVCIYHIHDIIEDKFDFIVSFNALLNSNYRAVFARLQEDNLKNSGHILGFERQFSAVDSFIVSFANLTSDNNKFSSLINLEQDLKLQIPFIVDLDSYKCFIADSNTDAVTTDSQSISLDKDKYLYVSIAANNDSNISFDEFYSNLVQNTEHNLLEHIKQKVIILDLRASCSICSNEDDFAMLCYKLGQIALALSNINGIKLTVIVDSIIDIFYINNQAVMQDINALNVSDEVNSYALMCLFRTIKNELNLDIKLVSAANDDVTKAHLYKQLACNDDFSEIVLDQNKRYSLSFEYEEAKNTQAKEVDTYLSLDFTTQGNLNTLSFRHKSMQSLKDNEILVKTAAVGLNYRDVMWALGLLPAQALENGFSGQSLGLECSGTVEAVGKLVNNVKVGDKVIALAKNCFASHVVATKDSVFVVPNNISLTDAASIPVAFLTAYYSIVYKAAAAKGESILIHGGAGGVGLAAIQIAQDLGLKIYATAGSPHKRALLERLGVKHIYSSRSLSFYEEILKDTNGRGVDIVLNSLYKDAAVASLKLLAPFGRFIELGKRDFFENNEIHLKVFKDNLSFIGVDVDELLVYKPNLARALFNEIIDKFSDESYYTLPVSLYEHYNVRQAFLDMKASLHIGKIVVDTSKLIVNQTKKAINTEINNINTDGVYIITGALGGLGLTLVKYLAAQGAKKIYLIGRREFNDNIAKTLASISNTTVLEYVSLDVTKQDKVHAFIESVSQKGETIAAFYHSAVALKDAYIQNLTYDDYLSLLKTKVDGAVNFLSAMQKYHLQCQKAIFISSITTIFGNEGQANYVAANAKLEAIAALYRQHNINASTFLLGPIKDVGLLQNNDKLLNIFEHKLGLIALDAKEVACDINKYQDSVVIASLCHLSLNYLSEIKSLYESRFNQLRAAFNICAKHYDKSLAQTIKSLDFDSAVAALSKRIAAIIADQLGMDSSKISTSSNLLDLGIDSLSLMETISILEHELEIKASLNQISGNNSINSLAAYCVEKIKKSDESLDEDVLTVLEKQHGSKLNDNIKSRITTN